jgi:hypothetical protein
MPRSKKTSQGMQSMQGKLQGKLGKMGTIEEEEPVPAKKEYGRRSTTPRTAARRSSAKATTRGRAKAPARARGAAATRKAPAKTGTKISAARVRTTGARKARKSSRSR